MSPGSRTWRPFELDGRRGFELDERSTEIHVRLPEIAPKTMQSRVGLAFGDVMRDLASIPDGLPRLRGPR